MKAALLLAFALVPAAIAATSEKIPSLKLKDGTVLRQAQVLSSENDSLRIEHADGVSRILAENLPPELQKQFGLDPQTVAEARALRDKAEADRMAFDRKVRVQSIMDATKEKQDGDFQKQRLDLFRIVEDGKYNYAELDNVLLTSISVLKDAGRDDLAQILSEDRTMLRTREGQRANDKEKTERETMLARIKELETRLAQRENQPNVVVVQQPPAAPAEPPPPPENPQTIIVERPVFIPQTIVLPPSTPPHSKPPVTRPAPPSRPTPPATRPGGGGGSSPSRSTAETIARTPGSHLWKKK